MYVFVCIYIYYVLLKLFIVYTYNFFTYQNTLLYIYLLYQNTNIMYYMYIAVFIYYSHFFKFYIYLKKIALKIYKNYILKQKVYTIYWHDYRFWQWYEAE